MRLDNKACPQGTTDEPKRQFTAEDVEAARLEGVATGYGLELDHIQQGADPMQMAAVHYTLRQPAAEQALLIQAAIKMQARQ